MFPVGRWEDDAPRDEVPNPDMLEVIPDRFVPFLLLEPVHLVDGISKRYCRYTIAYSKDKVNEPVDECHIRDYVD